MAIMKMKRLRLIAMAEDRETILRTLQHMGCVEVSEAGVEPSEEGDASGPVSYTHLVRKVTLLREKEEMAVPASPLTKRGKRVLIRRPS